LLKEEEPVGASMELAISLLAAHSYATARMCDDIMVMDLDKLYMEVGRNEVYRICGNRVSASRERWRGGQRDGGSFNKDARAPLTIGAATGHPCLVPVPE
jgi:hypothetical protein